MLSYCSRTAISFQRKEEEIHRKLFRFARHFKEGTRVAIREQRARLDPPKKFIRKKKYIFPFRFGNVAKSLFLLIENLFRRAIEIRVGKIINEQTIFEHLV